MTRRIPQEPPPPNAAEIGRLVLELAALLAPQLQRPADAAPAAHLPNLPFTPETLARRWNTTARNVQRLCRQGKLGHFSLGRLLRIPPDCVVAYEAERAGRRTIATTRQATRDDGDPSLAAAREVRQAWRNRERDRGA